MEQTQRLDEKLSETKLQTYIGKFESLKMEEDENIAAYFLRVDNIVKCIIGLIQEVKEANFVWKILRSLPSMFNPKVSILEEISNM